jgi:hypothetical protein
VVLGSGEGLEVLEAEVSEEALVVAALEEAVDSVDSVEECLEAVEQVEAGEREAVTSDK